MADRTLQSEQRTETFNPQTGETGVSESDFAGQTKSQRLRADRRQKFGLAEETRDVTPTSTLDFAGAEKAKRLRALREGRASIGAPRTLGGRTVQEVEGVTDKETQTNQRLKQIQDQVIADGAAEEDFVPSREEEVFKDKKTIDVITDALKGDQEVTATTIAEETRAAFGVEDIADLGISGIQDNINALDAEEEEVLATRRERIAAQRGKGVPLGVVGGRISEIERQENERIDFINRRRNVAVNELKTKTGIVTAITKAMQTDFDNAQQVYENEFTAQKVGIEIFQKERTEERLAASEARQLANQVSDNARANLNTMFNLAKSGNLDLSDLSVAQQMNIIQLEAQAGLPIGTYQGVQETAKPTEKIVSTNQITGAGGQVSVQFVMQDTETLETRIHTQPIGVDVTKALAQAEAQKRLSKVGTAEGKTEALEFIDSQLAAGAGTVPVGIRAGLGENKVPPAEFNKIVADMVVKAKGEITKNEIIERNLEKIDPNQVDSYNIDDKFKSLVDPEFTTR